MLQGEYYLHTNGSLIHKAIPGSAEPDSSFVKQVWPDVVIGQSPQAFLQFLIEAHALGAKQDEIERLAVHNRLSVFIPDWREKVYE